MTLNNFKKDVQNYKNKRGSKSLADIMDEYNVLTYQHSSKQVELDKLANSIRAKEQ